MKFKKVIAILSVGLISLGLILGFFAFALSGFDFYNILGESSEFETLEYVFESSDALSLEVDLVNAEVDISYYGGDKIKVEYQDNEYYNYAFSNDANHLMVKGNKSSGRDWHFDFNDIRVPTVNIYVPHGQELAFDIDGENMNFTARDMNFKNFEVYSFNGDIRIDNIQADILSLENINGIISSSNTTTKEAIFRGTNGEINFGVLSVNKLKVATTNGSVYGIVDGEKGDYTITARTVNGSNNLDKQQNSGEKVLDITTVNGEIDVIFAK